MQTHQLRRGASALAWCRRWPWSPPCGSDADDAAAPRPRRRGDPRLKGISAARTPRPRPRPTPTSSTRSYDASDRVGDDDADRDRRRSSPTPPTRRSPRRSRPGSTARNDYLPDRGVPLLRRPDRQPEGRARGSDQRVADGRGVRRLRRPATRTPGSSTTPRSTPRSPPRCSSRPNEKGGETNISTGWHAIEFLLWGQDNNAGGPGATAR